MLIDEFKQVVARRLEMDASEIYGKALRLADIVAQSPVATNSIDLMEAVAGAMAELDIDGLIELPAMTLDNTMDELVAEVDLQLRQAA